MCNLHDLTAPVNHPGPDSPPNGHAAAADTPPPAAENGRPSPNGRPDGSAVAGHDPGPRPVFKYTPGWQGLVLTVLKALDQWVLWRYELRKGRWTKIPYRPTDPGRKARVNNPATWGTFEEAVAAFLSSGGSFDGVGFVFSESDGLLGFDLDHAVGADGTVAAWARPLLDRLSPCYAEISPSGQGVKGILRGKLPGRGVHRTGLGPDGAGALELYDRRRFFTITAHALDAAHAALGGEDRSGAVAALVRELTPPKPRPKKKGKPGAAGPKAAGPAAGPLDDDEVVRKARAARNGGKFAALFDRGDAAGYGSRSEADFALLGLLSFWTQDPAQLDRLYRRSALMRDKWDEARGDTTYGGLTIANALAGVTETYSPPPQPPAGGAPWNVTAGGIGPGPSSNGHAPRAGAAAGAGPGTNGDGRDEGGGHGHPEGGGADAPAAEATLANYRVERWTDQKGEVHKRQVALRTEEIARGLDRITPGWPKSAGGILFAPGPDGGPRYLDSPDKLFAWADSVARVDWPGKDGRLISQKRFFEHLRVRSESFESVETLPHWPPLPRTYYMHPAVEAADNGMLDRLLEFFTPHVEEDWELIRALILTPFWGGYPGSRPAFLITGAEGESVVFDPEKGRGIGKSTLSAVLSQELFGGCVDVSANGDIEAIKTRLLSPGARHARVLRLDNVKTPRFSWDDLEGLITAPYISGHVLYHGEGSRPNTITPLITLNGANLSKDMAQRAVPIKLGRPEHRPGWERELREFIGAHRPAILSDVRAHFEKTPRDFGARSRWAGWELEVLGRTRDPEKSAALIARRRGDIDDDDSARDQAAGFLADRLRLFGHDPAGCCVRLPSARLAEWLTEFRKRPVGVSVVVREVNMLGIPYLKPYRTKWGRGMDWTGPKAPPGSKPVDLESRAPVRDDDEGDRW